MIVDIAATSDRQHFRREIDAVESGDATSPEPGAGPAGSTPEISRVSDGGPRDRLEGGEQHQIHLVFHRRRVRGEPCAVPLADRDGRIVATVEVGKIQHGRYFSES